MKCEIITEARAPSPLSGGFGYGTAITVTTCRTHGVSIEGMLPIKDGLCIVGRIERLERLINGIP